jgi:phosphate acetyltransferase
VTGATRSIVIASPEGESGKSTVALGVLDLLVRKGQRVGVFRPVSRASEATSSSSSWSTTASTSPTTTPSA